MRKGQAALEYLITYGWGFVILIVVIGVLAYLGFLSPTRYIPARCEFGSQLQCIDYKLDAASATNNGVVHLQVRNDFGDDIEIAQIFTAEDGVMQTIVPASPVKIGKGTTASITVTLKQTSAIYLAQDDRTSVPMTIMFRRDKATTPAPPYHNLTGEVFATVQ